MLNSLISLLSRKQSSSSFSSCSTSSELQAQPLARRIINSSSTSLNNSLSSPRVTKTQRKSSARQTELADIQSDEESGESEEPGPGERKVQTERREKQNQPRSDMTRSAGQTDRQTDRQTDMNTESTCTSLEEAEE